METEGSEKAIIKYTATTEPPYSWKIIAVGENGTEMVLKEKNGSWVEAFFLAQDLNIKLGHKHQENK
ncbi:MAG: hypothetical protein WCV81_05750 [Microgenomates group bacterium]|jgi:hypothetical protein